MQKNNKQLHMDRQCKKKTTTHLHMDRQCKKTTTIYYGRQCKKTAREHYSAQTVQKKTTTIYIWESTYLQTVQKDMCKYTIHILSTHSVHKDTLNYQRHIIYRMGTSTLCTVSIHNVVYT